MTSAEPAPGPAVVTAAGLAKSFGSVVALAGADLSVYPGQVHGLMGINGSGKSTLLKVISGQLRPDAGQVLIDGRPAVLHSPADALARGIAAVSQESSLAQELTVAENVLMGRRLVKRFGLISERATRQRARSVLKLAGYAGPTGRLVSGLRPDERQLVEIARALSFDTRLLILDESTSSLTAREVDHLARTIGHLRDAGCAVLLVSHRASEVLSLCDVVTVLRDGRTVASGDIGQFDHDRLILAMTGLPEAPAFAEQGRPAAGDTTEEPALRFRNYRVPGLAEEIDLSLRAGSITGLYSNDEAVRTTLLSSVWGLAPAVAGLAVLGGRPFRPAGPRQALAAGVGYVSASRRTDGFVPELSVCDNLALAATRSRRRLRLCRRRAERATAQATVSRLSIRTASIDAPVSSLSGGNQQKVVLARMLNLAPRVLLLDEPTRGVDVRSKLDIYQILRTAADVDRTAILVSSSEDEELISVCDTICVIADGRIVATVDGRATTADELNHLAVRTHP